MNYLRLSFSILMLFLLIKKELVVLFCMVVNGENMFPKLIHNNKN